MGNAAMAQTTVVLGNVNPAIVRSHYLIPLHSSLGWTETRPMVLVVEPTTMYATPYLDTAVEAMVSVEWKKSSVARGGKSFSIYRLTLKE